MTGTIWKDSSPQKKCRNCTFYCTDAGCLGTCTYCEDGAGRCDPPESSMSVCAIDGTTRAKLCVKQDFSCAAFADKPWHIYQCRVSDRKKAVFIGAPNPVAAACDYAEAAGSPEGSIIEILMPDGKESRRYRIAIALTYTAMDITKEPPSSRGD